MPIALLGVLNALDYLPGKTLGKNEKEKEKEKERERYEERF